MLETAGTILNWAAAALILPLMALPLAALAADRRWTSAIVSTALVTGLLLGGAVFIMLAPRVTLISDVFIRLPVAIAAALFVAVLTGLAGGARHSTAQLAVFFDNVTRCAGRTVMWLIFAMAIVQFSVVILRYVFGINFLAMQESITYMHGALFLLAAGYALLTNDHVRVDIFYREAPPRRKALIDFLGTYLFLFPFSLLILWTSRPYVARSWAVSEGSSEASGIPALFLLKSCIPAFAVLMAMAGFVVAARAIEILRERR
ncbi:TRAP transporter small permease subunit [Hyphococcus sp.]|uniref:TRAP transporter small permease subunit n=1 Tax=Hyphococcus sp. TaxID=2038636 RepID=UPI003CCBC732